MRNPYTQDMLVELEDAIARKRTVISDQMADESGEWLNRHSLHLASLEIRRNVVVQIEKVYDTGIKHEQTPERIELAIQSLLLQGAASAITNRDEARMNAFADLAYELRANIQIAIADRDAKAQADN